MKLVSYGNSKLSLAECRKAVAKGEINYTDDELIKMRDWLDNLAEIALTIIEKNGIDNMNQILDRAYRNDDEPT
ncbi:MAG: hypothetical protein ABI388_01945 [Bacteroidia bacterium]